MYPSATRLVVAKGTGCGIDFREPARFGSASRRLARVDFSHQPQILSLGAGSVRSANDVESAYAGGWRKSATHCGRRFRSGCLRRQIDVDRFNRYLT